MSVCQLTVLVTSREPLNVSGEYEYLVPPRTLPNPEEGDLTAESVTLFVQRARMALHSFNRTDKSSSAIAGICLRLDGLPLAIELAAARIKLFNPHQILERLDSRLGLLVGGPRDLPDRQRTLRDTIDWSYDLLHVEEQKLFGRLSVFSGGRTIEAVEAVCRSGDRMQPIEGLESLVNKNLLYQKEGPGSEPRFYMLETIHEYAHERLRESGEQPLFQNQHLDYYVQLCEKMEPGYTREGQLVLFHQTEAEMDNIRSAFEWAMKNGKIETAARLITAVNYYLRYSTRGLVEGYRLSRRLLPYQDKISPSHKVSFLIGVSDLAFQNNDLDLYRALSHQALKLARDLGDKRLEAWALMQKIDFTKDAQAYERSIQYGHEALDLCRELEDRPGIAYALNRLGEIYRLGGELDRARQAYEESLAICIETGEIYRELMLKLNLGYVAYREGDYELAKAFQLAVLANREFSRKRLWLVTVLAALAGPLAKLGEPEKAVRMLSASARLMSELGLSVHPNDAPIIEQYKVDLRALLDENTYANAWAVGQLMTYDEAVEYALGEYLSLVLSMKPLPS